MTSVTLYSYLLSLPELTGHVHWDVAPVKTELYALLYEGPQGVVESTNLNRDLVSKSVSVALYRAFPTSGNLGSIRPALMALLERIERAVYAVNTDSDGETPLSAFHRAITLPPVYDPTTGYEAIVQFSARLWR